MGFFRHLPTTSETGVTENFEQLERVIEKLKKIPNPPETTVANTKAIAEILTIIRAG